MTALLMYCLCVLGENGQFQLVYPPAGVREWSGSTWKHRASFVRLEGQKVVLQSAENANFAEVATEALSPDDIAWLKAHKPTPLVMDAVTLTFDQDVQRAELPISGGDNVVLAVRLTPIAAGDKRQPPREVRSDRPAKVRLEDDVDLEIRLSHIRLRNEYRLEFEPTFQLERQVDHAFSKQKVAGTKKKNEQALNDAQAKRNRAMGDVAAANRNIARLRGLPPPRTPQENAARQAELNLALGALNKAQQQFNLANNRTIPTLNDRVKRLAQIEPLLNRLAGNVVVDFEVEQDFGAEVRHIVVRTGAKEATDLVGVIAARIGEYRRAAATVAVPQRGQALDQLVNDLKQQFDGRAGRVQLQVSNVEQTAPGRYRLAVHLDAQQQVEFLDSLEMTVPAEQRDAVKPGATLLVSGTVSVGTGDPTDAQRAHCFVFSLDDGRFLVLRLENVTTKVG